MIPEDSAILLVVTLAPWAVKWIFERLVRKQDAHEEQREAKLEQRDHDLSLKLDAALAKLAHLESEVRIVSERISSQGAGVQEAKARIDGISANYGPRLSALEQSIVELRTRISTWGTK